MTEQGGIFKRLLEKIKMNNELCKGKLELFDNIWLFDGAIQNKECSWSGQSYYIETNSTSSDNN